MKRVIYGSQTEGSVCAAKILSDLDKSLSRGNTVAIQEAMNTRTRELAGRLR